MLKKYFTSFRDNLLVKSSNPFFGTFFIVWLIKNWELIYSLFNFDSATTLSEKKTIIITHFTNNPFIKVVLLSIGEAFIVLIISYLLINISRYIINLFEKRVTPLVYKWSSEKNIVLKTIYDDLEKERERLESRLEAERDSKHKIQKDYEDLEKKYVELRQLKSTSNDSPDIKTDNNMVNLVYKKLKENNLIDEFESVTKIVRNKDEINKNEKIIRKFVDLNLIEQNKHNSFTNKYSFKFTEMGSEIAERILVEAFIK